ncbi:hypothetical protein ASPZODRAFT_132949 [Penicilliopsis zonata CBS 506.65]|uniref:CENP-V/GFA domain-containing protein n=1 Tax=Penicilliopsis zonata CBS 506.65 TaxID=1073090 RepID=A0A1L9SHW2_9EURO|nr:hypothetical protein ASPZODRAFT_132949 [Penicilliopsis zonata CBS 506.65]OJJ46799.1 hypothetical protein ASPZODRAFT_132949 [Penicilliopsis zonata CBS 506.65]
MSQLTGSCLCKKITYQINLPTSNLPKRNTGSGFSANIVVPKSSMQYTQGSPKLFLDRGDLGGEVGREFCPDCGTPLTSLPSDDPECVVVKSGTLDDQDRERCTELRLEIYHHRKDKWVDSIGHEDVKKLNGSMQ